MTFANITGLKSVPFYPIWYKLVYNCKTEHLKTELITEKSALKGLIYKNQEIESVSYNVQCTATMEHVT